MYIAHVYAKNCTYVIVYVQCSILMIVVTQDLVFSLKKLAKCILSEHYVQEQQNKLLKNCIYIKKINLLKNRFRIHVEK